MTMYKSDFNTPLARYNAKKRELRTSMLEYTERVRSINSMKEENYLACNSTAPLEIQARRKNIVRSSDPGPLSKGFHRSNRRQRPHSLDDKELLRNKELNQSIARRQAKSEYRRQAIVIPTSSSGPPNSPDSGKTNNFRVSFVSASDLYDLVDFGNKTKSPRLPDVEDLKLIQPLGHRTGHERKMAWSKPKDDRNSFLGKDSKCSDNSNDGTRLFGGLLTGTSISRDSKTKNPDITVPDSKGNTDKKSVTVSFNENVRVVSPQDKNEVYPLNVFLETAVSSSKNSLNKLRQRPKRAKRMQLYKSNLVVIPEDGDSVTSGKEVSSHHVPSRSSLAAIKEGKSIGNKQRTILESVSGEERYSSGSSRVSNIDNGSGLSDGGEKKLSKQRKKRHGVHREEAGQLLDAIIIKNSLYPTLPWEGEGNQHEINTRLLNQDQQAATGKHRKVKRLVFLRDQPDQIDHRRI